MNRFRDLLNENRRPVQAVVATPSALLAEMVAKIGFDSVLIDFQHGMMDFADVYAMLVAISTSPATPMVRVPGNDPAVIMHCLDAGAYGIVCPMIETREEAERFVAACRYPPAGTRSMGPTRAGIGGFTEYVQSANHTIMTIAQIETVKGYENLEQIAGVPGLDALFPGPVDLALSFGDAGMPNYTDPRTSQRLRHIVDVGHAKGLKVTVPAADKASADEVFGWGMDWVSVGPEWVWVVGSGARVLNEMRAASNTTAATG